MSTTKSQCLQIMSSLNIHLYYQWNNSYHDITFAITKHSSKHNLHIKFPCLHLNLYITFIVTKILHVMLFSLREETH